MEPTLDLTSRPARVRGADELFLFDGAVITDLALLNLYRRLQVDWRRSLPLFFSGERSTGKSEMARTAHRLRSGMEMRCEVHCRGKDWSRLRAELFGDASGWPGYVPLAAGSSLIVHDIDSMSLQLQSELVDAHTWLLLTARSSLAETIRGCALHPKLARMILAEYQLPPLRKRGRLDELFLHFAERAQVEVGSFSPLTPDHAALERLQRHPWRGNFDELHDVARGLLLQGTRGAFGPEAFTLSGEDLLQSSYHTAAPRQPDA